MPDEDEEDDEELEYEDHDPYGGRMYQTVIPQKQPWQTGTLVPDTFALHPAPFDERPITPMKNTMVYSREHSTLDFKDGKSCTLSPTEKQMQHILQMQSFGIRKVMSTLNTFKKQNNLNKYYHTPERRIQRLFYFHFSVFVLFPLLCVPPLG